MGDFWCFFLILNAPNKTRSPVTIFQHRSTPKYGLGPPQKCQNTTFLPWRRTAASSRKARATDDDEATEEQVIRRRRCRANMETSGRSGKESPTQSTGDAGQGPPNEDPKGPWAWNRKRRKIRTRRQKPKGGEHQKARRHRAGPSIGIRASPDNINKPKKRKKKKKKKKIRGWGAGPLPPPYFFP